MTRLAALDVGSNSLLMCVGEPLHGGDFRVVYDSARTTRLGADMERTGRLSHGGIRRTLKALTECRRKAEILGVAIARAVATAAVREAENPEALLGPAKEALGFKVEVISGEREGQLTFLGVAGPGDREPTLILDVGGSSTEVVLVSDGQVERVVSLPVGAARLKEAIPAEDILQFFVRVIQVIPDDLGPEQATGRRVVVVGGTATTLAAMRLELSRYDPESVEGSSFTRVELMSMVDRLRAVPVTERSQLPGLSASRAEIITSGGLLLGQILEDLGVESFTVSARGLRHGILAELSRGGS
jgi:exopolyphosphatase/guanosine-5'-triphosphate,3'-diphosphate pyrophosphatase